MQHNFSAAVTVFYTITPTGPGATACVGTPVTRSVIVNPVPVVTTVGGMTATACRGTAFSVTPVNGVNGVIPAGTTYSWAAPVVTGGLTGGAAGAGAANISGNLVQSYKYSPDCNLYSNTDLRNLSGVVIPGYGNGQSETGNNKYDCFNLQCNSFFCDTCKCH